MIRKLSILLVILASSCSICLAQNNYRRRIIYRHGNVHRGNDIDTVRVRNGNTRDDDVSFQRDEEPRTPRTEELGKADEEERYIPVSFNIDYGTANGNGMHDGHAIEMMVPVEVSEYGWNEDSRGISELDLGSPGTPMEVRGPGGSQELSGGSRGGLVQCGERQVDERHAVCCDGLVYRKNTEQDGGRCCGSVAYDERYFACCQGRAIVRKNGQLPLCCGDYARDTLPDRCRGHGYANDTTGLGSTCCRSVTGAWTCCIKGERCCDSSVQDRGTVVDVPGFRPACCRLANEDLTAQCCATTYEKVRVLPDCCNSDRLRPICCKKRDSTTTKCCPGTIGYCCGPDEVLARPTYYPPHLIHPLPVTYPPRPVHTDMQTGIAYARHSTRIPHLYSNGRTYPPRITQAPYHRYTTRFTGRINGGGYPVTPGQMSGAVPSSCCRSGTQQKPCCSNSRSATCCRSEFPSCCFTVYFNVTCCRSHMQQQQQQQQQHPQQQQRQQQQQQNRQQSAGNPAFQSGGTADTRVQQHRNVANPVDVEPLGETGLHQDNGHHQPQVRRSSTGPSPNQDRQRGVALSCCRLETRTAVTCCQDGYLDTGHLPLCCVSSPNDPTHTRVIQSAQKELQGDAGYVPHPTSLRNGQHRHRNDTPHLPGVSERRTPLETCNGVSFDAEEQICCNNTLRQRIGIKPACCNRAGYDSILYNCCNGKVRISCNPDYVPKKSMWGVLI